MRSYSSSNPHFVFEAFRRMIACFSLLCLLFPLSNAFAERKEGGTGAQPRLVVPSTIYEFGNVPQGRKVEHSFVLRNEGQAPLKIEHLHATCGCTAGIVASDTIAPGAETFLRMTFDTTGFHGPKVKTVRFYSNDSRQPSVLLSMQGTVEPDVRVRPSRIDFSDIPKGKKIEKSFTISVAPGSGIRIQEISSRSPDIEIMREDISAGQEDLVRVKIALKSTLPVGIFRDRIVIKTSSKNNPVVNIPVFARVEGDLSVDPSTISFGLIEGPLSEPVSRSVRLLNKSGQAVRILDVESDSRSIEGRHAVDPKEKSSNIVVTVQPDVTGAFRARIKVKTDHADPDQQELDIPVYGIVTRGSI